MPQLSCATCKHTDEFDNFPNVNMNHPVGADHAGPATKLCSRCGCCPVCGEWLLFLISTIPSHVDKLIVAAGLAPSRSAAQRLVKQNVVSIRFDNDEMWWPLTNLQFHLPDTFVLKVGKQMIRIRLQSHT